MISLTTHFRSRRHRKLLALLNLPERGVLLDISCGKGAFLESVHKAHQNLTLYGIDISEESVREAKAACPWGSFSVSDAGTLPYPANTFDVVISRLSLHHYSHPDQVFKEAARVLVPHGTFYLMDLMPKNSLSQKLYNHRGCKEPYHFEKFYLQSELESLASTAGFILRADQGISKLPRLRSLTFSQ